MLLQIAGLLLLAAVTAKIGFQNRSSVFLDAVWEQRKKSMAKRGITLQDSQKPRIESFKRGSTITLILAAILLLFALFLAFQYFVQGGD